MSMLLTNFYSLGYMHTSDIVKDIEKVIGLMKNEGIELEGWELFEIPANSVYCFYNRKMKTAFDFCLDEYGVLHPHYYRKVTKPTTNVFKAESIKEAIELYEIL